MAVYAHDCCFCEATRAPLEIFGVCESVKVAEGNKTATIACQCPFCDEVTVLVLWVDKASGPANWDKLIETDAKLSEDDFWVFSRQRAGPENNAIAGVPEHIEKVYRQAVQNRRWQNVDAAGVMFRKVLELSIKYNSAQSNPRENLAAALKVADAEGRLPKEFLDWAMEIKSFGNISAHQDLEPSPEDLEEIAGFTEMVLRYLFEMPKLLSERRLRQGDGQ